jgi:hypothetical protein
MDGNPRRYRFNESYDPLSAIRQQATHSGLTEHQLDPAELFDPSTREALGNV